MRKRLRSTCKWSGTALTALLLAVWVGSRWWAAGLRLKPTVDLGVAAGQVYIGWEEPWSIIPLYRDWYPPERYLYPFSWWFDGARSTMGGVTYTDVVIPIWALVVLFATPTLWLWRCDRRRQPGLCVKCGYDLRGNASGVCPECGAAAPGELRVES